MVRIFGLLLLVLSAGAVAAQEKVIARCYVGDDERQIIVSERDGEGFWTEGDRRIEAQMIRSVDTDGILGITANRLDGSLSMLSLERPTEGPAKRRRAAALTVHQVTGGDIAVESFDAHCDVEGAP